MKKSDIAMIVLIGSVSLFIAYFIMSAILGKPQEESVKIKTIDKISTEVQEPNSTVFNKDSINPTVEIIIGGNAN